MKKLVKGDQIIVILGRDRGKQGEIVRCLNNGMYLVRGINLVKKHTKPNPTSGIVGGILEKEKPIHVSNIALLNPATGKGDKVNFKILGKGHKIRIFKSTGEVVGSS